MTFNSAITTPQYTKLRASQYQAAHNISLYSNRVVFSCQCFTDLTSAINYAAFGWHNTLAGASSAVEVGQTILVSLTNDITQWTWRLRVRLTPTNTGSGGTISCNETDAHIPLNAYLFFIDTFEVWDCLSRPTLATPPVQLEDFEQAYQNLLPSITGLSYQYAGEADASSGKLRVVLAMTGTAMASGATISSWLVTPRAGQATLISGSYSSATVTFDLDPSTMTTWGETWFTVALTDSNGNVLTRHSGVKITNNSHPPDVGFENIDLTNDLQRGWSAKLPAFQGVNSVLAWTLGVVWRSEEVYGTTAGALGATSNIDFVGYLIKDNPTAAGDPTYTVISQTTFDMVDVAARLANIEMQLIGMFLDVSPVLWDHITNLTVRRGIWHVLTRHSTAVFLVDVQFDTLLSDDSYLFPILSTQGQNSLAVCNGIAAQVNAALEFGPDGTIIVTRDARFLTAAQRNALVTVASFNAQGASDDCTVLNVQRSYEPVIGVLDGNGAISDTNSNVQVFQSRSPGAAQGMAQGTATLANQILIASQTAAAAQAELNQRNGNQYEILNSQETITLDFPDGYNFFIASHGQWYTLNATVDMVGPNGVQRITYTTAVRWLLEQVHYALSPATGERKPQVTLRRETRIGDPGFTVQIPPQPSASLLPFSFTPIAFPGFDFMLTPPEGITAPPALPVPTAPAASGGGTPALLWTTTRLFLSFNYAHLASPAYADITPSTLGAFTIREAIVDLLGTTLGAVPVYCLASDGTNSAVWYCANAAQAVPVWTQGALISGVYTIVRLTKTAGAILVYGPSVGSGATALPITLDFTAGQQGFVLGDPKGVIGSPNNGFWVSGHGFESDNTQPPLNLLLSFYITGLPNLTISSITVTIKNVVNNTAPTGLYLQSGGVWSGGYAMNGHTGNAGTTVTDTTTGAGLPVANITGIQLTFFSGSSAYPPDALEVPTLVISGTGNFPSSANSQVAYSTNYGATFATALVIAGTPGSVAGFDTQHGGTASFAAAATALYKATTLGGAYSSFLTALGANPLVILIPWAIWGSTATKNTTATPDFIYGTDATVSGDTLWCVVGSTKTAVTPKISGTPGIPVGANCLTTWLGTRIAGLFSFSGTVHLMTGVITNSGTPAITWTDRGAFAGLYIRGQYYAKSAGPLYLDGSGGAKYTADYGANLYTRTPPATSLLGIEPGN